MEVGQLSQLKSEVSSPLYEEVYLSDEEMQIWSEWAFKIARKKKGAILNEIEYAKKIRSEKGYKQLTYKELYTCKIEEAKKMGMVIDDWNREVFELLCLYYSGDPAFELSDPNYSSLKGIMLLGNVGCGKTSMLELFKDNAYKPFVMVDCREVSKKYQIEGPSSILHYSKLNRVQPKYYNGHELIGWSFDDFGTEDDKKNFGNSSNVMLDVFLDIYRSKSYGYMAITTNLDGNDIEMNYGIRLRSRMREMFNVIAYDVDAPDRRL